MSGVLHSMGYTPLWGKNGFVSKAVKNNSDVIGRNGDLIISGSVIRLPERSGLVVSDKINEVVVKALASPKKTNIELEERIALTVLKKSIHTCCDLKNQANDLKTKGYESNKEFISRGHLKAISRIIFNKISAIDKRNSAQADVFSDAGYGVNLQWNQLWSSSIKTSLFVDFKKNKFRNTEERSFVQRSANLFRFGFSGLYQWQNFIYLSGKASFGEEVFLFAPSSNTLRLDKGNTLAMNMGLGFNIIKKGPFVFASEVGINYLNETEVEDYRSEASFGKYAIVHLSQNLLDKSIFTEIRYEEKSKDTTFFNQDHTNLSFGIGMSWAYGK